MKRYRTTVLLALLLIASSGFLWLITRGNAVWRIHHHYPAAVVRFAPSNSPDPAWSDLIRMLGINYYSARDPVSVELADAVVDFSDFRGMTITLMHLRRCRVSDVRDLLSEYHPYVRFEECDLSAVPADQMRYLGHDEQSPGILTVGLIGVTH